MKLEKKPGSMLMELAGDTFMESFANIAGIPSYLINGSINLNSNFNNDIYTDDCASNFNISSYAYSEYTKKRKIEFTLNEDSVDVLRYNSLCGKYGKYIPVKLHMYGNELIIVTLKNTFLIATTIGMLDSHKIHDTTMLGLKKEALVENLLMSIYAEKDAITVDSNWFKVQFCIHQ